MDDIFEHMRRVMDDMTFSGFFDLPDRRSEPKSPRDEMLRHEEYEYGSPDSIGTPEPWIPFPFFGDLVKPDMMDREYFSEVQRQRMHTREEKRDIILDNEDHQSSLRRFFSHSSPNVETRTWSKSVHRSRLVGPDGSVKETERMKQPDGSVIETVIEHTSAGERKRTIMRKPSGEVESHEVHDSCPPKMLHIPGPKLKHTDEKGGSGLLAHLKRWFWREP